MSIGERVQIHPSAIVDDMVEIGNDVIISALAYICQHTVIHDWVFIGPCAKTTNCKYPTRPSSSALLGVTIEERAMIGAGAIICPGITIGHHAVVGAGAVVTHDVLPHTVVVGNPAKEIKKLVKV